MALFSSALYFGVSLSSLAALQQTVIEVLTYSVSTYISAPTWMSIETVQYFFSIKLKKQSADCYVHVMLSSFMYAI